MLFEVGAVLFSLYTVECISTSISEWATGVSKIKRKFKSCMEGLGITNKKGHTFEIEKVYPIKFGFRIVLSIPSGLSKEHLINKKNIIEDNLNAIVEIKKDPFKNYILLTIVNKDVDKFMFKPVKHKVNQIYLGKDFKGSNYFVDLDKNPMLLIAGATGNGKSMLLSNILANITYNHSNRTEIYLTQLIKGENSSFENCKNVKYSAYTKEELQFVINKIRSKVDSRTDLFKTHGIRNINQWNKHYTNRYMKRIFLICEEMSELMQLDVWEDLWAVVKAGRSVGIHFIGVVQRTTANNLDPNIKSQTTIVTFKQNNSISSINAINCNAAMDLKIGECIIDGPDGLVKIKVPYIDDDFIILNKYIPEIKTPGIKEEVIINKIDNDVVEITETPQIVEVDYKLLPGPTKTNDKPKKNRKGVISLKEIENVDSKRW